MNHHFRSVWSPARGTYIVAHEKAAARGRPYSTRKAIVRAVAAATLALGATGARATDTINPAGTTLSSTVTLGNTYTASDRYLNVGAIQVSNADAFSLNGSLLGTLSNTGSITSNTGYGVYLWESTVSQVINNGSISGDSGVCVYRFFGAGSTIGSLVNIGTISATNNGIVIADGSQIGTLTNSGVISGNSAGLLVHGLIGQLNNSGVIKSSYHVIDVMFDNTLTSIVNSGTIAGKILNQSTSDFTIHGGSGTTFGILTGSSTGITAADIGTITNTNSNVVFGSGNELLNDNINVGSHAVTNTAATLKVVNPISITGNYSQSSGATLVTTVASASSYGKLTISGTATLAGNLFVDAASASGLSNGTTLNVIHAGAITGNFSNVTDSSTLFDFTSTITGTDFSLEAKAASQAGVYQAVKHTGNNPATGASRVLDGIIASNPSGAIAKLFQSLSSEQAVSDAVSQTLPLMTGGSTVVAQSSLGRINRIVQARLDGASGMSSGDAVLGDKEVWVKPFGSWADQHDRGGVSGYSANTGGIVFGADAATSPDSRLGFAFAYANSRVSGNSSTAPNSATVDVYQLLGYGSHTLDANTELSYQLGLGQNSTDGHRIISFSSGTADASYRSLTATAGLGLEKTFKLDEQTSFLPSIRADYSWIKDRSYRETGSASVSPLLLDVDSRSSDELILGVNGKINHKLNSATTIDVNAGVGYDVINKDASILASYAGAPGTSFVTHGIEQSPWLARGGFGLVHKTEGGMEINVRYDAEYRTSFLNHSASAKLSWAF